MFSDMMFFRLERVGDKTMAERITINYSEIDRFIERLSNDRSLQACENLLRDNSTISGALNCRESVCNSDSVKVQYEECERNYIELLRKLKSNWRSTDTDLSVGTGENR